MASSGHDGDAVGTQEATAHEGLFRCSVQASLDTANARDTVAAKDVEADAKAWRTETQRKRSRSTS